MSSPTTLRVERAAVFEPLWESQARYKGAYGGRGSAKSHDRALACAIALTQGKNVVAIREVQKSIADSVKSLVERKIETLGLRQYFEFRQDKTVFMPTSSRMIYRGMQDHTATSIKSLEDFDIAYVEEAQQLRRRSLDLLIPTIRNPGSELWFVWNPEHSTDPVDELFRGEHPPANSICVRANYEDNPWFPAELRADMEHDRATDIEKYNHVWRGGYKRVTVGAYYAKELAQMYADGRGCWLPVETGIPIDTWWDIGIRDLTCIWVVQRVGREWRILDYCQGHTEAAAYYARWIRDRGYDSGTAELPHDAGGKERGSGKTYEHHLHDAGLKRTHVNERTLDKVADIQTVRAFLAQCWFHVYDDERGKAVAKGLDALGSYQREFDDRNNMQTFKAEPLHNWASHPADAFHTGAIRAALGDPSPRRARKRRSVWAA